MKSFLTGSQVYGKPNEKSDIDLVCLLEPQDANFLWANCEKPMNSCRFGKLNIIVFTNENNFLAWKRVTEDLKTRKPVPREEAIEAFKAAGFDYGQKPPAEVIPA